MTFPFKCELSYFSSPHLSQLYDGFQRLADAGIVSISYASSTGDPEKPLLAVTVNDSYRIIYDTLDGLNWIDGTIEDNLQYFQHHIQADFYFKRSFNKQVAQHAPPDCKVYPLGLNYAFSPTDGVAKPIADKAKDLAKLLLSAYYGKLLFSASDFEHYPVPTGNDRILFLARLWNPADVALPHLKAEREAINQNRINCIRACRAEFGDQFVGGLQDEAYSRSQAPDLILPSSLTRREPFLRAVKQSDICIATAGLHDSIGWKFGEYVAAARAMVAEPLAYMLPGDFTEGTNYLPFTSESELIANVRHLLNNPQDRLAMMRRNFDYYQNHVRSDILVLNTLLKISETREG
ncbi:hypothetical protein LG047_14025 [Methylocystis sp. WRRC1]|uniref:hypothetical protein n=1 Tax=Methylocystis sp. WRRC1 TaxID=1732014 RepID=UPI001D137C72|nr:hypothetical protein [Methylocystis sp. WRRC1]MCC3246421.1 hypothetical protein [Methylocystis sp. WRRC1]